MSKYKNKVLEDHFDKMDRLDAIKDHIVELSYDDIDNTTLIKLFKLLDLELV